MGPRAASKARALQVKTNNILIGRITSIGPLHSEATEPLYSSVDIPISAIKAHHQQTLERAGEALIEQDIIQRRLNLRAATFRIRSHNDIAGFGFIKQTPRYTLHVRTGHRFNLFRIS